MVVRKKQTVASGVKNDDKVETVESVVPAKKRVRSKKKPVSKKKHKQNDFPANKETLAKKIKQD